MRQPITEGYRVELVPSLKRIRRMARYQTYDPSPLGGRAKKMPNTMFGGANVTHFNTGIYFKRCQAQHHKLKLAESHGQAELDQAAEDAAK